MLKLKRLVALVLALILLVGCVPKKVEQEAPADSQTEAQKPR